VLGTLAVLRAFQRLVWSARVTPETPSARYLLQELRQVLQAGG
jgi:hypothetical protein